jgi:hypothetical protein
MTRKATVAIVLMLPAILAACGTESSWFAGQRANIAGAASVTDSKIENVTAEEIATYLGANANDSLEKATDIFNAESVNNTREFKMQRRDTLQDRLLVASQNRCNFYEEYLKRFQGDSSSFFGAMTTILGGAGAIATNATGARTLAGLASIFSGVGAEMQKDLFANLASTVIVPGIEKRRHEILQEIVNKRCLPTDRYTIGLALMDAIRFHGACSMDVGVAEAGAAVNTVATPGSAGLAAVAAASKAVAASQANLVTISSSTRSSPGAAGAPTTPDVPPSSITLPQNLFGTEIAMPTCPKD